jgi:hypothetical protein
MREIKPALTPELERHTSGDVAKSEPYTTKKYNELVRHIARLAYLNKDHLLFYRGQGVQFKNKAGGTTFYPSIYRGDSLDRQTIDSRFRTLEHASRQLRALFVTGDLDGHREVARKRLVQWSILQHYEVCATPLLDVTHSIRVACSFAQAAAKGRTAFVYVFGLPFVTNRISSNSEHDLVLVRLLSICPPAALRPYFQEGYLVGTADVTTEYEDKSELDLNRRLVAQFEIPSGPSFWGAGLSRVGDDELFPEDDSIRELCLSIDVTDDPLVDVGALGAFVAAWTGVEQLLVSLAQDREERAWSAGQAIRTLKRAGQLSAAVLERLERLRDLRNKVVHGQKDVSANVLQEAAHEATELRSVLRHKQATSF